MPPKKSKLAAPAPAPAVSTSLGTVKIDSFILQIRNLCRGRGLQIWQKTSLSDLIYKDILFLHSLPRLQRAGYLNLDVEYIGIPEASFAGLMSLKEPELINAAFKRLWKQLQVSTVSKLFDGRDFAMAPIEKKDATKYLALLTDILRYASSVELAPFDSDSGHTYFNKDLNKANAKTFGQFYTPGSVVKSIVHELNLTSKDTLLDPSCGSCSFLQEACDDLMKKEGISAEVAFTRFFGVEVEPNIYIDGLMNTFTRFGMLPDMEHNIREADAFKILLTEETQYDKIPANPPFGADAKSFQEFYFKTIMEPKGKKLVKNTVVNPDLKFKIPFPNTGESAILFFQMIVQKLTNGGKAGVVMSSTILNDGNKELIKWFLETCSLEKVIINPAGTFKEKGTGIETFSFIFTKGVPTTEVKIVMLGEEDKVVRTLTLDQIKEAGWKLQLKEEEKKVAYTGVYELKKLGDIAIGNNGKGLGMEETMNCPGSYPILSGGINYCGTFGKFNRDENTISLSKSGSSSGYVKWNSEKFWASDCFTVHPLNTEVLNNRFLYYSLSLQQENIYRNYQVGGTIPHCYWRDLENLQIPLPPLPIQQEIVTNLDRIFADPQDSKDCLAFTDKAMDLMLKDPTGKQLEDVLSGLRLKRAYLTDATSVKSQMAAVVRSVGARGFERKKLNEACDISKGRRNLNGKDTGYPYQDVAHVSRLVENYILDGPAVLTPRAMSVGRFVYTDEKCHPSDDMFILKAKDGLLPRYLFHYCNLLLVGDIRQSIHGVKPTIDYSAFDVNHIIVPPLPIQHEVLAILNEMEAELATLEQMALKAEKRAKFILDGYLTPPPTQADEFTYNENGEIVFEE